ncbi:hypothetical protein SAMN05444417_2692 [Wenxinia saemankumensis]|uniref:Uncharacterized protein n=1 Tax=Wenxinia saemankumensis TaxID=1447782 RepID=A0A1M6G565_9RHOB|nr:hypothetical protein SAMN05444417_2692 [Wenxinia saemankumensis]
MAISRPAPLATWRITGPPRSGARPGTRTTRPARRLFPTDGSAGMERQSDDRAAPICPQARPHASRNRRPDPSGRACRAGRITGSLMRGPRHPGPIPGQRAAAVSVRPVPRSRGEGRPHSANPAARRPETCLSRGALRGRRSICGATRSRQARGGRQRPPAARHPLVVRPSGLHCEDTATLRPSPGPREWRTGPHFRANQPTPSTLRAGRPDPAPPDLPRPRLRRGGRVRARSRPGPMAQWASPRPGRHPRTLERGGRPHLPRAIPRLPRPGLRGACVLFPIPPRIRDACRRRTAG